MNKSTIGIDIDSVLADFQYKLVYVINDWFGKNIKESDIVTTDLQNLFCLNDEEYKELFERIFADTNNFPVIEGAYEGCKELKESGFDLMVITSRRYMTHTYSWLKKNGFEDFDMKIHFLHYYPELLNNIEYILDDYPKKIARLFPYITKRSYLLETPLNKKYINLNRRYRVVKSWPEFVEKVIRDEFGRP